jgi:peptide/nickel transport system substrate-binding protein
VAYFSVSCYADALLKTAVNMSRDVNHRQCILLLCLTTCCALSVTALEIDPNDWPDEWHHPLITAHEAGLKKFSQAPILDERVQNGNLPPLADRLPADPVVLFPIHGVGKYGGTGRVFFSDQDKINPVENGLTVDPTASKIFPNTFESWTFSNGARTVTFKLRAGLKWSDGSPHTSDDYLFFHQHVLMNSELTPVPFPRWNKSKALRISETEFQFDFAEPFPLLINVLAQLGDYFVVPAEYMKQFHPAFVPRERLMARIREAGYISWMSYFTAIQQWTRHEPPLAPTMRPFIYTGRTPTAAVYERNPYYWKIDTAGNQLPYIDRIRAEIINNQEVMAAKAATGQVDFASFSLKPQDFPLFKLGEKTAGIKVHIWNRLHGSDVIIQPNLNIAKPKLRAVFNDLNFRKALSVAINREEMNSIIYFNQGTPRQATVIPSSRFYEPEFASAYTQYDPDQAKAWLDEVGLVDLDDDGLRNYPDGEAFTVTLEYIDFESPKNITLELATSYWREVGLDIRLKQVDAALQNSRATAGLMEMTVWAADRTTDILFPVQPFWYVPMHVGWEESHWNDWSRYFLTGGKQGERPPPDILQLQDWWREMIESTDDVRVTQLGKLILKSTADNLWTIGIIGYAPQPVVVSDRLKNVAPRGIWGWDNRWTMPYHAATWYLEGSK